MKKIDNFAGTNIWTDVVISCFRSVSVITCFPGAQALLVAEKCYCHFDFPFPADLARAQASPSAESELLINIEKVTLTLLCGSIASCFRF